MLRTRMSLPPRHIPPLGPPKLSRRDRALATLRGAHAIREERANALREKSAGELMGKLFKDLRMDRRRAEAEIVRSWNSLIDPNITAHAQPVGLAKGTLFVNVDNSVWSWGYGGLGQLGSHPDVVVVRVGGQDRPDPPVAHHR